MNTCQSSAHTIDPWGLATPAARPTFDKDRVVSQKSIERQRFQEVCLNQRLNEIYAKRGVKRGLMLALLATAFAALVASTHLGPREIAAPTGFDDSIAPASSAAPSAPSRFQDLRLDDPRDLPLPPAMEYGF